MWLRFAFQSNFLHILIHTISEWGSKLDQRQGTKKAVVPRLVSRCRTLPLRQQSRFYGDVSTLFLTFIRILAVRKLTYSSNSTADTARETTRCLTYPTKYFEASKTFKYRSIFCLKISDHCDQKQQLFIQSRNRSIYFFRTQCSIFRSCYDIKRYMQICSSNLDC